MEDPDCCEVARALPPSGGSGKVRVREVNGLPRPTEDDKAPPMRRLFPLAALFLAACATPPKPTPAPAPSVPPTGQVRTNLTGLTEAELLGRFGPAPLRVREGSALKLQWQNATCVLDTYLYPPANGTGAATVLHADARRPGSGETVPVEGCVVSLSTR